MRSASQPQPGSTSPVGPGPRLNHRIGLTAEAIHRSVDRERATDRCCRRPGGLDRRRPGARSSPGVRIRTLGRDHLDRVRPILILSPFFSRWAANIRRPLSQVPFVERRSSTYQAPCANWKRAWWLEACSSPSARLPWRPAVKSVLKTWVCSPAWTTSGRGGPGVGQGGLAVAADGGHGGPPRLPLRVGVSRPTAGGRSPSGPGGRRHRRFERGLRGRCLPPIDFARGDRVLGRATFSPMGQRRPLSGCGPAAAGPAAWTTTPRR